MKFFAYDTPIFAKILTANIRIWDLLGHKISNIEKDTDSRQYYALNISLSNINIKFRVAKITPTKTGQFVTFWKRSSIGPIAPYDISDPFDLLVVNVLQNDNLGQFVFSKSVLLEHNIISENNKEGKRAMRVYAPWDIAENKQSKDTAQWQRSCFINISDLKTLDFAALKLLYKG